MVLIIGKLVGIRLNKIFKDDDAVEICAPKFSKASEEVLAITTLSTTKTTYYTITETDWYMFRLFLDKISDDNQGSAYIGINNCWVIYSQFSKINNIYLQTFLPIKKGMVISAMCDVANRTAKMGIIKVN